MNSKIKQNLFVKNYGKTEAFSRSWKTYLVEVIIFGMGIACAGVTYVTFATNSTGSNFVYPLKQVSNGYDCRTNYPTWGKTPDSCKTVLPRIGGANYNSYATDDIRRNIYSIGWLSTYTAGAWDTKGSHPGWDIMTAKGTPLYAITNGKAIEAGTIKGFGKGVLLELTQGGKTYYAMYAHMDSVSIKAGDQVTKGQEIGTVGNSGIENRGGKPHLHFEIRTQKEYAYLKCQAWKDAGYDDITVADKGLCQDEVKAGTVDSIAFLETNSAIIEEDTAISTEPDTGEEEIIETERPIETAGSKSVAMVHIQEALLPADAKDFVKTNTLAVSSYIKDGIQAKEKGEISIIAKNKKSNEIYEGIAPAIEITSPQSDVKIEPTKISMLVGETKIKVTPSSAGAKTIVVSLGGQQLATVTFTVTEGNVEDSTHTTTPHASAGKQYACLDTGGSSGKYFF